MSEKKKALTMQGVNIETPNHSNNAHAQRQRIADYLAAHGRATTLELRSKLDVLHPAGRIKELRRRDWQIQTIPEVHPTDCGKLHRVGVYVLIRQPKV